MMILLLSFVVWRVCVWRVLCALCCCVWRVCVWCVCGKYGAWCLRGVG